MKAFGTSAPDPTISKWLRGRIDNAFRIVEKHLIDRTFMVGSQPTIADMSLCGYLYFPQEESGYNIEEQYPAIAKWLERVKELPGWKTPYEMLPGQRVAARW
jgi:glutathione S-transferase